MFIISMYRLSCKQCGKSAWNQHKDHVEFQLRDHKLDTNHDVKIEEGYNV